MTSKEAAQFGKALSDLSRHKILRLCCCKRYSVGEIAEHVKLRQPTVTHHLTILHQAGLVDREQEGKQVYYKVNQKKLVSCCGNLLLELAPDEEGTHSLNRCC